MRPVKSYFTPMGCKFLASTVICAVVVIVATVVYIHQHEKHRGGVSTTTVHTVVEEFGHVHGDGFCGTKSLTLDAQLEVINQVNAWRQRKRRRRLTSGPYTVDVRFIDIKASSADADVPQADIDASMATLNDHFASSDFNFNWIETERVVNSEFATCGFDDRDKHASIGEAYREGDATVLNVYLCDIPEEGRAGLAYYPYEAPLNIATDGIYIDPTVIGQGKVTLSHEAGHWLGLQHTFENGCEFPGDWIADTNYQTELTDSDVVDCENPPDTCPELMQTGTAPVDNLMGYVIACYSGFTPEQLDFMCNIYERYRLFSSETGYCFIDMIVEFNDNPSDVKIHVENNGIYYYEEDGANYAANERVVLENVLYNGPGSVTIEDASGNGFAGGRVIIEVLETSSSNSPRATVLEFEGGSFTVLGTEDFVVPDNCAVAQQITDEPTQQTADAPTQAPLDETPSPPIAQTPVDVTPSPPLTTAPVDTIPAPTASDRTLAPTRVPLDMTESPVIPQVTVAPKSSSSFPIQGSLPSSRPSSVWKPTKPHYGLSPKQKHHWKEPKKKHVNIFQMGKEGKESYDKGHYSRSKKGKKSMKNHKGSDYYHGHHKNVAFDHKKSWRKHGTYTSNKGITLN